VKSTRGPKSFVPFHLQQLSKAAGAFDARAINTAIITLKQTACRCPTVGAAAPAALGGRRGPARN